MNGVPPMVPSWLLSPPPSGPSAQSQAPGLSDLLAMLTGGNQPAPNPQAFAPFVGAPMSFPAQQSTWPMQGLPPISGHPQALGAINTPSPEAMMSSAGTPTWWPAMPKPMGAAHGS